MIMNVVDVEARDGEGNNIMCFFLFFFFKKYIYIDKFRSYRY